MSASVFAFPSRKAGPQPWTNDELAELYRVVDVLGRAGLPVVTDMGMSDEGDPWFVFCRCDSGDVIAHFARIAGQFVASSIAIDETYRGANFRQIVDRIVQSQPLILPPKDSGTRLLTHPTVILIAFVATALAHSEKLISSDSARAVEARWEHHHTDDAHGAVKHGKMSLFESVQALFKSHLADDRAPGHAAGGKDAQPMSLASLIAIAMTAMQPLLDKVSLVSHAFAEEFVPQGLPDHGTAQSQNDRAAQDLPVIAGVEVKSGDSAPVAPRHEDAAQPKKMTADSVSSQGSSEQSALQAAAQNKLITVDDVSHANAVATPHQELSVDSVTGNALFVAQKIVTAAADSNAAAAPTAGHGAELPAAPHFLSFQDIAPETLQFLNIHTGVTEPGQVANESGPGSGPTLPHGGVNGTGPEVDNNADVNNGAVSGGKSGAQTATQPSLPSGTQSGGTQTGGTQTGGTQIGGTQIGAGPATGATTVGGSGTNGTDPALVVQTGQATTDGGVDMSGMASLPTGGPDTHVLNYSEFAPYGNAGKLDFVNAIITSISSGHAVAQQVTFSNDLLHQLAPEFGTRSALEVVFFTSNSPTVPAISTLASSIAWVDEKLVSPNANLSNAGGNIVINLDGGETITIVGVTTIFHTAT